MSAPSNQIIKTTPQLFRDCLRLIKHIAGNSTKAQNISRIVRQEFKRNAHVKDKAMIDTLKSGGIRGLANYMLMESTVKDQRFQNVAEDFTKREINSLENTDNSDRTPKDN